MGNRFLFHLLQSMLHIQNESITIDNVMSDTSEFSLPARSIIEFSQLCKEPKSKWIKLFM